MGGLKRLRNSEKPWNVRAQESVVKSKKQIAANAGPALVKVWHEGFEAKARFTLGNCVGTISFHESPENHPYKAVASISTADKSDAARTAGVFHIDKYGDLFPDPTKGPYRVTIVQDDLKHALFRRAVTQIKAHRGLEKR